MTLPLLSLLGFIAVCGTVAYSVAAPALVPSLVTSEQLPAANARIELARTDSVRQRPGARRRAGRMGRRGARVRLCRGAFRDRGRAAVGHL